MNKIYKHCQSCNMPLNKDKVAHYEGKKYCGYCYVDGAFTKPDINVKEMKKFVCDLLVGFKFPRVIAKFLTRNLHRLERWQQSDTSKP